MKEKEKTKKKRGKLTLAGQLAAAAVAVPATAGEAVRRGVSRRTAAAAFAVVEDCGQRRRGQVCVPFSFSLIFFFLSFFVVFAFVFTFSVRLRRQMWTLVARAKTGWKKQGDKLDDRW